MLYYWADVALPENVPVYASALINHVPMLSYPWFKKNISNEGYILFFLGFFFYLLYSMPKNGLSQHPESQAKVARCLRGWTRSSCLNSDIKRKHTRGGSIERWPGRNTATLSWACIHRVRKAKTNLELNVVRDLKGNKKGFYRYIGNKTKKPKAKQNQKN